MTYITRCQLAARERHRGKAKIQKSSPQNPGNTVRDLAKASRISMRSQDSQGAKLRSVRSYAENPCDRARVGMTKARLLAHFGCAAALLPGFNPGLSDATRYRCLLDSADGRTPATGAPCAAPWQLLAFHPSEGDVQQRTEANEAWFPSLAADGCFGDGSGQGNLRQILVAERRMMPV